MKKCIRLVIHNCHVWTVRNIPVFPLELKDPPLTRFILCHISLNLIFSFLLPTIWISDRKKYLKNISPLPRFEFIYGKPVAYSFSRSSSQKEYSYEWVFHSFQVTIDNILKHLCWNVSNCTLYIYYKVLGNNTPKKSQRHFVWRKGASPERLQ